jgi:hypothetical protein
MQLQDSVHEAIHYQIIHWRTKGTRQDLKVCCSTMEMALQSCGCQTTMPDAAPCAPSYLLKNLQQSHKEPRIRKLGKIQMPLNQTKDFIRTI